MIEKEYKKQYKELRKKLTALAKEYLNLTFPYKVGDVVEDKHGKGRIVNMELIQEDKGFNNGLPYYTITLKELREDGTDSGRKRYQCSFNIKKED